MPLQNTYRGVPEPNLASYDFYDLFTGTGYKNFYLADLLTGAATTNYILTTTTYYSNSGATEDRYAALDLDFDLLFNVPISVEGDAVLNIYCASSGTNPSAMTINLKRVTLASAEVQIGTEVSKSQAFGNDTRIFSAKYNIPLTRFKAGEKLRITITMGTTTGSQYIAILHDPKNRTTGLPISTPNSLGSASIINLPLKL